MALILHSPFLLLLPSVQAAWSHREVPPCFGDVASSTCKERCRLTPGGSKILGILRLEICFYPQNPLEACFLWSPPFRKKPFHFCFSIHSFPIFWFFFSSLQNQSALFPNIFITKGYFHVQCVNLSDARWSSSESQVETDPSTASPINPPPSCPSSPPEPKVPPPSHISLATLHPSHVTWQYLGTVSM